ncbi:MAG: hypothetical protein GXO78_06885 [Calditrichaeota bacterium]|nr:hypothetical protein [Calditrichota bacterium]
MRVGMNIQAFVLGSLLLLFPAAINPQQQAVKPVQKGNVSPPGNSEIWKPWKQPAHRFYPPSLRNPFLPRWERKLPHPLVRPRKQNGFIKNLETQKPSTPEVPDSTLAPPKR